MEKISIIVPVYNSEPFLTRCLNSIASQTYTNLEILCIDDGSSDRSVEICDEYASKDKRFRIIRKETKGGSGNPCRSANIGLKSFTGAYVGYVETDDWVEPNMYEKLYKTVKYNNASIGAANYFVNDIPMKNIKPVPIGVLSPHDMLMYNFDNKNYQSFHWLQWNKLYSADFFTKHNVLFSEKYLLGYDPLFSTNVYLCEGCAGAYIDNSLYHYSVHESSISMSPKNMLKKSRDSLNALKETVELLKHSKYTDIVPLAETVCADLAFRLVWECVKTNNTEMQKEAIGEMLHFGFNSKYVEGISRLNKIFLPKDNYFLIMNKNILLFGSGNIGQVSKAMLETNGISPKYFVDNDKGKHGQVIDGIKVISLEEAAEIVDSVFIIGIYPGLDVLNVYDQLRNVRINEENIFYIYC